MHASKKVVVIGLDGATFDLLDLWLTEMPFLRQLISGGVSGRLRSVVPPITAPAWASFMTGANPGKHGVFSFIGGNPFGQQPDTWVDSTWIDGPTIWDALSRHGLMTGVIDLPMTYPPRPLSGFMVCKLADWGPMAATTYPSSLLGEILSAVDISSSSAMLDNLAVDVSYVHHLTNSILEKERIDLHLMNTKEWDCFITIYEQTDVLQHYFWRHLHPTHPRYDFEKAQAFQDALAQFFQAVDSAIQHIVQRAGNNCTTIVVSDHGFGSVWREVHINRLLIEKRYLCPAKDRKSASRYHLAQLLRKVHLDPWNLKRLFFNSKLARAVPLPGKLRMRARKLLERGLTPEIDKERSAAYYQYSNRRGVFINPSTLADHGAIREEVISDLLSVRDPLTGECPFEFVARREDIYSGPHLSAAPDILIGMREGYVSSSKLHVETIFTEYEEAITGDHRPEGIFLANGEAIKEQTTLEGAGLIDVAPTILYLLNVPIPRHMDGRVLGSIVKDEVAKRRQPTYYDEDDLDRREPATRQYTEQEEHDIRQHLEGMGYLG